MTATTLAAHGGNPVRTRPFPDWPQYDAREEAALLEVLYSRKWWSGSFNYALTPTDAPLEEPASECMRFQREFALAHDCRFGLAATNGTATLTIILRALGVGPGDEVIVPPYTFIASASTILEVGAAPVFVDIDPHTYNIDPRRIEEAITPRTRAIIVVHFGGLSADMDAINEIANKHGLTVIEDAAHAHGASWQGRACGSIGAAGSFSFQASKNMTAGEGGMITTNDAALAEMCHSVIWLGRKQGGAWYEHHYLGSNWRMTEFQAAVLRVQLSRLAEQTARRDANGRFLAEKLSYIQGITPVELDPRATRVSFHLFCMHYHPAAFAGLPRDEFIEALNAEGIPCSGGYLHPLYRNPLFLNWTAPYGGTRLNYADFIERCPASEAVCEDSVWFSQNMLLGDIEDMLDIVRAISKIKEAVQ
ncbi:MAG: DegT/DnrJ/EryC1/StrS family aminotransferase [Armatimonadota bacterium]